MTRRMFRYSVFIVDDPRTIQMSPGAIVHVEAHRLGAAEDTARHLVNFWAEHDDELRDVARTFRVYGTGYPILSGDVWRGTTARTPEGLVWHLYELSDTTGETETTP